MSNENDVRNACFGSGHFEGADDIDFSKPNQKFGYDKNVDLFVDGGDFFGRQIKNTLFIGVCGRTNEDGMVVIEGFKGFKIYDDDMNVIHDYKEGAEDKDES